MCKDFRSRQEMYQMEHNVAEQVRVALQVLNNNGRSGKPAINDGEPFEQVKSRWER